MIFWPTPPFALASPRRTIVLPATGFLPQEKHTFDMINSSDLSGHNVNTGTGRMQENISGLDTPVRYFKGVGPRKAEALSKLGIKTALDLLYYLPSRYEDRSRLTPIKDLKAGLPQAVRGQVVTTSTRATRAGASIFQAAVSDGTGIVHAIWFNQPYLKDYLKKGTGLVLYGRVEKYDKVQFVQPEYEMLKGDSSDSIHTGRIVPIYPLTEGIAQRYIRGLAFAAVAGYSRFLRERLPTNIIARQRLVDIRFAVNNIHFPSSAGSAEKAYRRIVFDEFFALQLALAMKRGRSGTGSGNAGAISEKPLEAFTMLIPFELTGAQRKAISDIERDMSSTKPMHRLLEGDVGSGKTVVAAYALYAVVRSGMQGALMAPTEVLARQHFLALSEMLMPSGINVALLVGGMDDRARSRICAETADGRIDILVGTHSLIQEPVGFRSLGLAVIDEQHKFGVSQKALLKKKGRDPHILVMTATPIPRTLALTVYGDLDISVIKQAPKGRKPVMTYWVDESRRDRIYDFIKGQLRSGRQAYIICPLIDGKISNPGLNITNAQVKSATATYEKLKSGVFKGYEVGLLHGRMDPASKDSIMRDFKKGKIGVLVSTVVIEVGIDVPNATVMLVEDADRFGMAQLHQLRGRVGRGPYESYCILLADPKTDEAARRLKSIEGTSDGFRLAEEDLEIRGPGEFFGTKQHGLPEIRFGDILKDFEVMEQARIEAFALIDRDPGLDEEHHARLKEELKDRFKNRMGLVNVA